MRQPIQTRRAGESHMVVRFDFVMAGLDPAIGRHPKAGASMASSRLPRVITGSSPAMTKEG
jgi:hypothetical protein